MNLQSSQSVADQTVTPTPAPESDSKHHAMVIFACVGGGICGVLGVLIIAGFINRKRQPARYRDLNEDARFDFTETDRAADRGWPPHAASSSQTSSSACPAVSLATVGGPAA